MQAHEVIDYGHRRSLMARRADGYDSYGLDGQTADLRREHRDLATGMAFLGVGSAAREPMQSRLRAVAAELSRRNAEPNS